MTGERMVVLPSIEHSSYTVRSVVRGIVCSGGSRVIYSVVPGVGIVCCIVLGVM